MFPNGWPGAGLLLLRLVAGSMLIHSGVPGLAAQSHQRHVALLIVPAILGALLLIGFWTPVAGILLGVFEMIGIVYGAESVQGSLLLGTVSIALAMTGPGMWSIDARMFGRRRLEVRDR